MKKMLLMLTLLFGVISVIMGLILACVVALDTVNNAKSLQKNAKNKACRYIYNKIAPGLE
jgi:ABC-type arginine/histidine transport system permease subunit